MAKGKGRQMEIQERTMTQFSKLAKIANTPGFKQNRLIDKLINEGIIRRTELEKRPPAEKAIFSGKLIGGFINGKTI
jgi:hypothetical protein